MFLLMLLTLTSAGVIFTQDYKEILGQIILDDLSFSSIKLKSSQQLIISVLNYDIAQIPLLMACQSRPSFKTEPDKFTIQRYSCVADLNNYDLEKNAQNVVQVFNPGASSSFSNFMFTDQPDIEIVLFAKTRADFTITINLKEKSECFIPCQNDGICTNGKCRCVKGYLGLDCGIRTIHLQSSVSLFTNEVYSVDVLLSDSLTINFLKFSSYTFQCYSQNPFIKRGDIIKLDSVSLSPKQIQTCLEETQNLNSIYSSQIYPYFTFVIFDSTEVTTSQSGSQSNNNIIYITTTIGSVVLFVIIYCCLKCKRAHMALNDLQKHPMSQKIAFIRYVNKYMPLQTYHDLISKFPGLGEDHTCQICLENYVEKCDIRITYCTHFFHMECIDAWILRNEICPTCRSPLNIETYTKMERTENDELINQGGCSTKQILSDQSQRKVRLFGNRHQSGSPIMYFSPQDK